HPPAPSSVRPYLFFLLTPRPARPTLFPYTTLFRSRGALAELDERISGDSFDMGVYFQPAIDGCTIDGKIYGLPKDISDHVVYLKDRKSTRLNSSHVKISYAVFCLKKKKQTLSQTPG